MKPEALLTPMQRAHIRARVQNESRKNPASMYFTLPVRGCEQEQRSEGRVFGDVVTPTIRLEITAWRCNLCDLLYTWPRFEDETNKIAPCPSCDVLPDWWWVMVQNLVIAILRMSIPTLRRIAAQMAWDIRQRLESEARLTYQRVRPGGNARQRRKVLRPHRKVLAAALAQAAIEQDRALARFWTSEGLDTPWNPRY